MMAPTHSRGGMKGLVDIAEATFGAPGRIASENNHFGHKSLDRETT